MKTLLLVPFVITGLSAAAQTEDSVTLGAQYNNESYYSLINGEVANTSNSNWDLAFDLSPFGAAIRMNRRIDVLYLYPGTTADWAILDTTGHGSWQQYIDGYASWSEGALNAPAGSDPEDLGWGTYNTITHGTDGSRLFVIKLDDDSYRKLYIEELVSGTYSFKYANIDGTHEISETITKSDYAGKNFIYYSLLDETVVDREPASADWDIVFTNYVLELGPGYFGGVTSVLANSTFNPITVAQVANVPVAEAQWNTSAYTDQVDQVGYDWKTFDMGTFSYVVEDSLCFFVRNENDEIWKLWFTGFEGSSTGKIRFMKEQVTFASVEEEEAFRLSVFPQPAGEFFYLRSEEPVVELKLLNLAGQEVYTASGINRSGDIMIPVQQLENGLYILKAVLTDNRVITRKIIINS